VKVGYDSPGKKDSLKVTHFTIFIQHTAIALIDQTNDQFPVFDTNMV